jgi:hypothetical protein
MARERINGYLHPDVVTKLEEIAVTNRFRSIMPAIELCLKQLYPGQLEYVVPGKYGTDKETENVSS